jgi:hypothetical protein
MIDIIAMGIENKILLKFRRAFWGVEHWIRAVHAPHFKIFNWHNLNSPG